MNRRTFLLGGMGGLVMLSGGCVWNLFRQDAIVLRKLLLKQESFLTEDLAEILYLASLAPSGHNTQPWTVKIMDQHYWVIGAERSRWLPAVDSENREMLLSLGAFLENLIVAANAKGYAVETKLVAKSSFESEIVAVKLYKDNNETNFNTAKIKLRRTIRNHFLNDPVSVADITDVISDDRDSFIYYPKDIPAGKYLAEGTILANRIQVYRNPAQEELAKWIRWSKEDREKYRNGLTPAGMEIEGIARWYVENFYSDKSVLTRSFREETIQIVQRQVTSGSGWLLLVSKDSSISGILAAGRKLQRMWLKLRDKNIAIHPMTQMLEEDPLQQEILSSLNINKTIQFLLRVGYVKDYPKPVSPRMTLSQIIV